MESGMRDQEWKEGECKWHPDHQGGQPVEE
jgi:hypothetical protein